MFICFLTRQVLEFQETVMQSSTLIYFSFVKAFLCFSTYPPCPVGTKNSARQGVYRQLLHVPAQINPTTYNYIGSIYPAVRVAAGLQAAV